MRTSLLTIFWSAASVCYGGAMVDFGTAAIRKAAPGAKVAITVDQSLGAEAFRIRGQAITGGDERGAMYGALDYAEQVELYGAARDKESRPNLGVRALKFNVPLPGTGYLSDEDLANNQWFWDLNYWRAFLDMAARNRYNAITLWSAHPFDRMTRIAKYPEATDVPAAELDRNIAFFRSLFQMAADRGLDVYLITWNIHVSRAFAKAHGIPAAGFDSPLVRDYQREAIKALFSTYPALTGMGTTAGERMPNMTNRQKLDYVADTYFAALREIGRPTPFILRYWQSDPEEMAQTLERVKHQGPVYLDIKFNGEHMYSSPKLHLEDQRWIKLAPGHWSLLWHLRNDDLFILRWGDPDFVRAAVKNMAGSAGFVEGSELDVPGGDRIHTAEAARHLDWRYKFEKHWFRYMLWGRLGYAAAEPDATWRAHYTRRFGAAGADIYEATRQASKILPSVTAYHWNYMNGDWYPEGSIGTWNTSHEQPRANYRRATMYHDIRTYIFNNTIDGSLTGIPEFIAGKRGGEGPLEAAARIERYGRRALELTRAAAAKVERGQKEFECTQLDLEATGNLGIYYAEKLRGATELARVLLDGVEKARPAALRSLENALAAWRKVVAATAPHYITHEVWLFGQFDWKRYTPDVEADIRIARDARPIQGNYAAEGLHVWLKYINSLRGQAEMRAHSVEPVRVAAEVVSAASGPKAGGESITGARDYIVSRSPGPLFRFKLPAAGEYELWATCLWPERGAGFVVLVDENNTAIHTLRAGPKDPVNEWSMTKLAWTLRLGAGEHTVRFFGRQPGARIDRFLLVPVGTAPEWARTGRFRAARWDGGPIEAEKGRLSGWPHFTDADERGVMAATRDWYNPRTVEFLKTAHINWAWLTWSVGFSTETERAQREQVKRYIAECHKNGIRVAAYFSIANMFWKDMFEHVPASREWVEKLSDGSPRFYSKPHRYMAQITDPAWRAYQMERVQAAVEAGADSFWIDNTFGHHGAEQVERFLAEVYDEATRSGRPVVVMSNYNRGVYTWARFQNGVTTEGGKEPGYYAGETPALVTNAGLLRYHYALGEGWRPVSVEYGGRQRGERFARFTTPMEPKKWQLSLAECAAFQASLEPFFEGLFLRDLYHGEPAALEKLAAIGKYNAFFEKHEEYYRDSLPVASVAVLADEASDSLMPMLNELAARNVQFEVIFNWRDGPTRTWQDPDLERFERILVPEGVTAPERWRARFAGKMTARAGDLTPGGPVSVDAPGTVLYNVVRQERLARTIVHLLNYAQRPTPVILRTSAAAARVLSPDFDGAREVKARGGVIRIPDLDTYALVVME